MSEYCNPAMKQLTDQQVRYAPRHVRLEQIEKAERLLEQIKPLKSYRYTEICEQVTSYRSELYPDLVIPGADAVHDLRCFVEDLSDSANISVASVGEPVLTVQDVSKQFNVSTKTIARWRNRGLVSRRFKFGARKRIGFLKSSVERFVRRHADDVGRGAKFSQLSDDERGVIIHRARRLVRHGGRPAEVIRRVATKLQRSLETIRYTLKTYDAEHPDSAVFPDASATLTAEDKKEIFRSFQRGVSADRLATRFRRTKTSIYRIISETRARRLHEQPIAYIDSTEFSDRKADERILGDPPKRDDPETRVKVPPGLPPYLASLYAIPLLRKEEEVFYFRKMNYLKCKVLRIRDGWGGLSVPSRELDTVEALLEESLNVKNFLIRSNLRLVVSIAKRHIKPNQNFFEMVSDGNMSLIRAIEKFDYSRGNKFSTYASWAIMKNFARSIPAEHTRLDRFRTGNDEVFQYSSDTRANHFQEELVNRKQHQLIMGILEQLDDREREIIKSRFGLTRGAEPQTLEQVGSCFGVTKERIRQLEARALKKLRKIAQDEKLDVPGV